MGRSLLKNKLKMWSYYGSKSRVIKYYPKPRYGKIIEPFAGSARYSLQYFENDITLVDKYEVVVKIWKFLQNCSPSDIIKLPKLKQGDKINRNDFDCIEMAWLFGFMITQGNATPMLTVSKWGSIRIEQNKKRIASELYKIKHWNIIQGCYTEIPDETATWFIDPPYQVGGHKYKHNKIDYAQLNDYANSRSGLVIVCENNKASWMNFSPLAHQRGVFKTAVETVWMNEKNALENNQITLFKKN